MSRVVMPRSYSERIFGSMPASTSSSIFGSNATLLLLGGTAAIISRAVTQFNLQSPELLTAGLSLTEAHATMAAQERVASKRELFQAVLTALSEGRSFSDVLSRYPQHFSPVLVATVRDLPWLSAAMLQAGQFINAHELFMGGLLLAVIGLSVWAVRREQGRAWLLGQVLRIPWLAERVQQFRLARFYRGVSLLLDSGIPLARALPMVGGLLGADQQENLARARRDIETGKSLSVALAANGLITPVAESLIRVGERAGNLADMLERTARFHDEEFSRFVDTASKLLEPLLMTLIGLVVGTVVVLMYIPIFELAGSLQ